MNSKFGALIAALVVIALVAALALGLRKPPAHIDLLVTPVGSTVTLDGHGVKSGLLGVKAGDHSLTASRSGFASQTQAVNLKLGETRFVGFILQPNSAATANWYTTHTVDAATGQAISARLYDQTSKDTTQQNPLLTKLPYIGPGVSYRIDYGFSQSNSAGQPAIYVRYKTDADKQNALDWIKQQGADPSTLDIVYISDPNLEQ